MCNYCKQKKQRQHTTLFPFRPETFSESANFTAACVAFISCRLLASAKLRRLIYMHLTIVSRPDITGTSSRPNCAVLRIFCLSSLLHPRHPKTIEVHGNKSLQFRVSAAWLSVSERHFYNDHNRKVDGSTPTQA